MLIRATTALQGTAVATGLGALRGLATKAADAASQQAAADSTERPLSGDAAVRQARRQLAGMEPPLLHDSLSEANYDYTASARATAAGPRYSSITEPDYYLNNSLSEGTYGMPQSLQRSASLNPTRGQGFATAKQRPTMQRVVAAVRAADQGPERLHDSFEKGDYDSPYKGGR